MSEEMGTNNAYETLLAVAKARRTCRNFSSRPVPEEAVERILAAASLGLTSQWVSVHTQGPLKEILGIPETLILHTLIPIGYPDDSVTLPKGGWREPLEKLVHQDWYEMEKHLDNRQMLGRLAKLRTSTKGLYKPMVK